MPDLAATLKEEIRRLARKEIKAQTTTTKQAVSQYRRDIARLKRQLGEQEKKIACLEAREQNRSAEAEVADEPTKGVRFSARSVKAQRKRLKLSAEDYAKLVGVSAQTIYLWEHGKSRPREAQLAALVRVRGLGRREALAELEAISAAEARKSSRARKGARRKRARNR